MGSSPKAEIFLGFKCDRQEGEELCSEHLWLEEFESSEEYSGVGICILRTDWNDSPERIDTEEHKRKIEAAEQKFAVEFPHDIAALFINCDYR